MTIILTVGKYAMLVAIYAFVLVVFRGIITQLAAESRRGRTSEAAAADSRQGARPGARPAPSPRPRPEPVAKASPPAVPAEAPGRELKPPVSPPAARSTAARIDLLGEVEEAEARDIVEVPPLTASEPEPAVSRPEPPSDAPSAPHLLVLESEAEDVEPGDRLPLSAAVTIGRSEENSLPVSDRFISSRHALICLRDGRRILVDRGSTNGTFVNGDRVEDEIELCDGDRIALGNTVLEYHAR